MAASAGAVVSARGVRPAERRWGQVEAVKAGVALILADENLRPLYFDPAIVSILAYPDRESAPGAAVDEVQSRLRRLLNSDLYHADASPTVSFLSGRRSYLCRSILLRSCGDNTGAPMVALLLERQHRTWTTALADASRRFNLSQRETETVQHLTHGLTTKEIASRMAVSPNTVKQFVRLIMSKMCVTTRAGILGKIVPG